MPPLYPVCFRIPWDDVVRLDRIAQKTCRTRAEVLRLLVVLATETGHRDVMLTAKDAKTPA